MDWMGQEHEGDVQNLQPSVSSPARPASLANLFVVPLEMSEQQSIYSHFHYYFKSNDPANWLYSNG